MIFKHLSGSQGIFFFPLKNTLLPKAHGLEFVVVWVFGFVVVWFFSFLGGGLFFFACGLWFVFVVFPHSPMVVYIYKQGFDFFFFFQRL